MDDTDAAQICANLYGFSLFFWFLNFDYSRAFWKSAKNLTSHKYKISIYIDISKKHYNIDRAYLIKARES